MHLRVLVSPLVAALREQRRRREALLDRGARRVGWKLGLGDRERIGDQIAVGYLTTDSVVPVGRESVAVGGGAHLYVDAELCIELGTATGSLRCTRTAVLVALLAMDLPHEV